MDLQEFLAPRVLIVSGKGGVGKTTVSAALALVAARAGRRVCVASVDQPGMLPRFFDASDLGYEPSELAPGVWGMNIVPDEALAEYLDVQYHMKRIARVFSSSHFVDYITATAPGLKDILVLGKVWYLEQGRSKDGIDFDTIIVDAHASGHMLQFLSAPTGLSDAVKVGPVKRQSEWLAEMLQDPARTRVHLVSLAEEMPVSETLETSASLAEKLDISLGPIFANALYPELLDDEQQARLDELATSGAEPLRSAGGAVGLTLDDEDLRVLVAYERFLRARRSIQAPHLKKLRKEATAEVIELPHLFGEATQLPGIETLADAIEAGVAEL